MARQTSTGTPKPPALDVRTDDGRSFRFSRPFLIGRDQACDVQINVNRVSRRHVLVAIEGSQWHVHDQESGNGIYVDGQRVDKAVIGAGGITVSLGPDGPSVKMAPTADAPVDIIRTTQVDRYVRETDGEEPAGKRTIMFRVAIKKQRRTYRILVGLLLIAGIAAAVYAYRARRDLQRIQAAGEDVFYQMKAMDVLVAQSERRLQESNLPGTEAQIKQYQKQLRDLEKSYEEYVSRLGIYDHALSNEERAILRVTRRLGECDMAPPPDYLSAMNKYINNWRRSNRFVTAVNLARQRGYTHRIVAELKAQDLPIEFFYLALQESNFRENAVGPPTRYGFAKGMWMFIKDTGREYGLHIGPLADRPVDDPEDERQQWEKATPAAARYIKKIYATDAQASGLLVMASYNWGETRVRDLIRKMPENPRDRNFWQVLAKHGNQVPGETYNYVMNIVSAAAIGEDPELLGFKTTNPLAEEGGR